MIKIIPEQHRRALSMAIAKGEFENVKTIIEQNKLDVDSFLDDKFSETVVMAILSSRGISDEGKKLELLHFVLEKGANPNIKCKDGYNCLHIVTRNKAGKVLALFLDFDADVNLPDNNGATVAYWAIQAFPWRTEGEERQIHLKNIEKIIALGANLDHQNRAGITPRKWLENTPNDVQQLVEKGEALKPVYKVVENIQPEFPSNLQYPEVAKKIWNNLVPGSGPAESIQGELLRAIEKLRDEAQRNGNGNYDKYHKSLAKFIENTLTNAKLFDEEIETIKMAIQKLQKASSPYLEDDIYDYLTDKICFFYLQNQTLIKYKQP